MEPTAIDNKPRSYERPTLIVKKSRDSIAYKEPPEPPEASASPSIDLQYRFEENGNEETDNYNLTSYNSPTFSNYVELDGIDDYLSVGIDFQVKTLSFWFNLTDVNIDNYLLSFDSNFYIKVNYNSLYFQTDIETNCNIPKDFTANIWYNLALTYNNTNYDIYLNNSKLLETIIYKDLSSSTLNIGKYTGDEIQIDNSGITNITTSTYLRRHSMVAIDDNMYIFGGQYSSYYSNLYKIDTDGTLEEIPLTADEETTTNKPSETGAHSMVAIGSNIYIFGGYSGGSTKYDNLYKIDTTTKVSTNIELRPINDNNSNKPSARYDHSMVAIGSNMYIFGGYDGADYKNDLYKIDTEGNAVKIDLIGSDKPSPRYNHSMVVIGTNMYIFGGYDGVDYYSNLYKIDTEGNSVKIDLIGSDKPSAIYGHSMVAIGTNMYIFGGYDGADNKNDLYKIDTEGNSVKITLNEDKVSKRIWHTMVILDNSFYIFGGLGSSALNDLVKIPFTPDIKYLNGKIADLRLYNTIKTEDEINTSYNEYNYVNSLTHISEQDIDYDFSGIATFQGWKDKADSHNIQYFNFHYGTLANRTLLSDDNTNPDNFVYIKYKTDPEYYNDFSVLLLELPTTHNYVEFTITPRNAENNSYTMLIDTLEKLDENIFISDADKNYKFEDNIEKFDEEYYYFAQFTSASSVTKKYNYKPGHHLKIERIKFVNTNFFDPNIKITLKKNYTEYPNLTFNENELFDILVVGGGGGGGYNAGGGGGAGGLVYGSNIILDHTNVHNIKVGKGGIVEVSSTNGSDTTFGNIIAMGGGGGVDNYGVGNIGGSGGGSSAGDTATANSVGGSKAQIDKFIIGDKILIGYGNDGGIGRTEELGGSRRSAGGGGGAGSSGKTSGNYETDDGQSSRIDYGGDGGVGRQYDITGIDIYYAGGGGGGIYNSSVSGTPGNGGLGGGGNGGQPNSSGTDGVDGTGSGGGGNGGNGGSGIVILKKIRTDPPAPGDTLTLNIVNDLDSGYTLDSNISSNYANITKIILNVNANIYRNDKPENYGEAGLIIDLNSLTNLKELELNINPSKGIYGGPGSPGTSGDPGGGLGGNPIKIIGNRAILLSYTAGAKLFKGGKGGDYTDWGENVKINLEYKLYIKTTNRNKTFTRDISISNINGLIGEFFNGNKKVKYNYNIIDIETIDLQYNSGDYTWMEGPNSTVTDDAIGRTIFNDNNVYKLVKKNREIDIYFVNKPAEGLDMTAFDFDMDPSVTSIAFNNNYPIIYDFSHITSLADWNNYATNYGFTSTFDVGFREASGIYYTGVWYHDTTNMVAWYKFDGDLTNSIVGSSIGTLESESVEDNVQYINTVDNFKYGKSALVNNSVLDIPNFHFNNLASSFTISFWFKANSITKSESILFDCTGLGTTELSGGLKVLLKSDNFIYIYYYNDVGKSYKRSALNGNFTDSNWRLYTFTFTYISGYNWNGGTNRTYDLQFYENGVLNGGTDRMEIQIVSSGGFQIGAIEGYYDNFQIYNKALSQVEITYHDTDTGFISKEIPTGYTNLRVEYQALWDNTVSIYITENAITTGTGDIGITAKDTVTVAEGLKVFETTINTDTDKYLTIAERYSTLSNNLKISFFS